SDLHPAISANPYQSFYFKVSEAGEFKFVWKDDDGSEYVSTNKIQLA
ncbi:MAG: thiosulfate oxidation carrier complex protein SoxZ, partial [Xanthobacteraceae bacterium]